MSDLKYHTSLSVVYVLLVVVAIHKGTGLLVAILGEIVQDLLSGVSMEARAEYGPQLLFFVSKSHDVFSSSSGELP
jgi:hypothetical protein